MKTLALLSCVLAVAVAALGCNGGGDDGLTQEQTQAGDRVTEIIKKSGGKWDSLTAEDRAYLVDTVSNGNEQAAKMMFSMRASRLGPGPGGQTGPPKAGPSGAPGQ